MTDNPLQDSVWTRCFFEVYDSILKVERTPVIEFSEVDKLVLEYTKLPILDFHKKFWGEE